MKEILKENGTYFQEYAIMKQILAMIRWDIKISDSFVRTHKRTFSDLFMVF